MLPTIEKVNSDQFIDRNILSKVDALVGGSSLENTVGEMLCQMLRGLTSTCAVKVKFFTIDSESVSLLGTLYRGTSSFFKKGRVVDRLSPRHEDIAQLYQLINS